MNFHGAVIKTPDRNNLRERRLILVDGFREISDHHGGGRHDRCVCVCVMGPLWLTASGRYLIITMGEGVTGV